MSSFQSQPADDTGADGGLSLPITGASVLPAKSEPEEILERNLAALARTSGPAVERIRAAAPREDLEFILTDDLGPSGKPALSAQIGAGAAARALGSRRRPLAEAEKLAAGVDVTKHACVVVAGFALGHHLGALAGKMRRTGVLVVYEPDAALLRGVLSRIDHSAWIRRTNIVLLTDADDAAAMSRAMVGAEGLMSLGVTLLEHPPSKDRLASWDGWAAEGGKSPAARFYENFTALVAAVRTGVVTTMVQMHATVRNLLMNLDAYTAGPGIAELRGAAARDGTPRPAIVVSAGPSLRRNLHLLEDPEVRARFVVIAVQTVLKTLLARGIKPDFVTALDHHEISRRFYEGLTAEDVEGVTLVVEPKANPAILDAFPASRPGQVRCARDRFLDTLLGDAATPPGDAGAITPGATVAHLSYYLARHLGCDPVILIGQDLGFTDGQYYAAGAAIHDVWAGELNPFNTLEMLEWQRIVRMKPTLRRAKDTLGRPIYSDEQMSTYLDQFQRDFMADAGKGLRIIDATEGGVAKLHTEPMTLEAAVAAFGTEPVELRPRGELGVPAADRDRVRERVRSVRQDVWKVGDASRRAAKLLEEMLAKADDQARVNALIDRVNTLREEVGKLNPAFDLVQFLNQTGGFNRLRTDRALYLDEGLTPVERQKRQIGRDLANVRWLAESADELGSLLDSALAALDGAPKLTRDPVVPPPSDDAGDTSEGAVTAGRRAPRAALRTLALIPVDTRRSGINTARDLGGTFALGQNPLRLTLRRLARCGTLSGAVLLTGEPDRVRELVGTELLAGLPTASGKAFIVAIEPVEPDPAAAERRRAIGAARLWADTCWRGGIGNMTVYDELLDAPAMVRAMERHNADAALLVGPDWCFVDPALCEGVIERHAELPNVRRVTFTQAPPGLAGCVIGRRAMNDLAAVWSAAGTGGAGSATLGWLLGYYPIAPIPDPIAHPVCAPVPTAVRDTLMRYVPDCTPRWTLLGAALGPLGEGLLTADAATVAAHAIERASSVTHADVPQQTTIELCTGRRTSGRRAHWERGSIGWVERRPMPLDLATRIFEQLATRPDAAVTIGGAGDPMLHPDFLAVIRAARRAGIAGIHVRTDLLCTRAELNALLEADPDVISVDLMAHTPATYRSIMGIDRYAQARENIEHLLGVRRSRGGGLRGPWIVPRITRCDTAYADIEPFFDHWTMAAGTAAIDPLPLKIPGERIEALPKPVAAARRDLRRRMTIFADGSVPIREGDLHASRTVGNVSAEAIGRVWKRLTTLRRETERAHGLSHPDLRMGA